MAYTPEQEFQLEMAKQSAEQQAAQAKIAAEQAAASFEQQAKANAINHKLALLQTAKDILIENKRNAPVSEREITHEEMVAFANSLSDFVHG